jgi:flagellar hook-associated protein 1 FlgK
MSISGAMNNALLGLTAAGRSVEVVSNNVANSTTEGYAPRDIFLQSQATGGVRVAGITRRADAAIVSDRQLADASLANSQTRADGLQRIENAIGLPTDGNSLSARLAAFDRSLIEAASQPDSENRLLAVLRSADDLTRSFGSINDTIQQTRMDADTQISREVDRLNAAIRNVDSLNDQIVVFKNSARDPSSLIDQRQQAIDQITELVPVQSLERSDGRISLYTKRGAALVDAQPATFSFTRTGYITPDMTLASGALSGLTLNGQDINISSENGPISGAKLSALFAVRDDIAPEAQTSLDAVARDLVERFQDPAIDPTLNVGDAGFFTDRGGAFDPADEIALSSRLEVNTAVRVEDGGETWRIRDGVNATTQGSVGDSTLLNAMTDILSVSRPPQSGPNAGISSTPEGLIAELTSVIATERQDLDFQVTFDLTRSNELRAQELSGGVDTDEEMQKLLLIEQAFAANARVVQTLDDLLQQILRI